MLEAHWSFSFRMFMYIFLGGLVVLMLFGVYQVLESRTVRCVRNQLFFFLISWHQTYKAICNNPRYKTNCSVTYCICAPGRRRGCQWKLKRAPVVWATWTSAGSLRRLSTSWVSLHQESSKMPWGHLRRELMNIWSMQSSHCRQSVSQSIATETSQQGGWSRSIKSSAPVERQHFSKSTFHPRVCV